MTTDVLRLQGNYLVQSSLAGQITLDTTAGANVTGASNSTGTVVVTGNLVVYGDTKFGSVTNTDVENMNVTDNLITLNSGELSLSNVNGSVTAGGGYAGIKIPLLMFWVSSKSVCSPSKNKIATGTRATSFVLANEPCCWKKRHSLITFETCGNLITLGTPCSNACKKSAV